MPLNQSNTPEFIVVSRILDQMGSKYIGTIDSWNSLYIDYDKPYVKRLWKDIPEEGVRLHVHEIEPCELDEAFYHGHAGVSVVYTMSGIQRMRVGSQAMSKDAPHDLVIDMPPKTIYLMNNPSSAHAVAPRLLPSFSLFVTWKPWENPDFPAPKSTKPLNPLSDHEKKRLYQELCNHFKVLQG